MIRLIGFDLDDTLWEVAPVIRRAEARLDDWLRMNYPALRYSVEQMRSLRHEVVRQDPGLKGQITEARRRIIELALVRSGISNAEGASREAIEVFLEARNQIEFFPGVRESLQQLSGRYTLCALSNGNADIRRLGLDGLFSFAFSAEQVGAPKPEPHLFHAALEHSGLSPEQFMYVGDDPVLDIDAANALGLRTAWVNTKAKPPGTSQADLALSSVVELPAALQELEAS